VPEVVEPALADPQAFSEVDHPLIGTTPGTIIDDLGNLDGCWAQFSSAESPGVDHFVSPAGYTYPDNISVLVFDARDKTIANHVYCVSEFEVPAYPGTNGPTLFTWRGTYRERGDRRIEITYTDTDAGVVRPNGSLKRNPIVDFFALWPLYDPTLLMTTVQGDYMSYYPASEDQDFDDLDADVILPWTRFYRRLECRAPTDTTP